MSKFFILIFATCIQLHEKITTHTNYYKKKVYKWQQSKQNNQEIYELYKQKARDFWVDDYLIYIVV